jgi:glutathione S-transferase
LFDVADNNAYGLKVFAVLRLCNVPFRHEHILDASSAPRGQLPFIADAGETIGDSDTIIAHLIRQVSADNRRGADPSPARPRSSDRAHAG